MRACGIRRSLEHRQGCYELTLKTKKISYVKAWLCDGIRRVGVVDMMGAKG